MTVVYEVGVQPQPKGRYRVEVKNGDDIWREFRDWDDFNIAKGEADYFSREKRTRARVVDTRPDEG